MPLYRTISDRGLWKKYKKEAKPQHFHKPAYIDRRTPVITYSQLNLGQPYRHNSRQSIPDVRRDIEEANTRFDEAYEKGFREKRNRFAKSCPTTPRATTPTRTLSRLRVFADHEPGGRGLDSGEVEDLCSSSGNVNGTGQFYPEDDRYSFESRSLTAYSNYSERDSVINEPNYRYPYARETGVVYHISEKCLERENPFFSGQTLNEEADSVIQLFLQNSAFSSLNTRKVDNSPGVRPNLSSVVSTTPGGSSSDTPLEDPLSAVRYTTYSTRERIKQLRKSFLEEEPKKPVLNKPKANRYLSGENRWKPSSSLSPPSTEEVDHPTSAASVFQSSQAPATATVVPESRLTTTSAFPDSNPSTTSAFPESRPTTALAAFQESKLTTSAFPENTASTTSAFLESIPLTTSAFPQSRPSTASLLLNSTVSSPSQPSASEDSSEMALSPDLAENDLVSDTVRTDSLPMVHHAEIVSVRQEESSVSESRSGSESDTSSDEEEVSEGTRNIMVNIKPLSASPSLSDESSTEKLTPRIEAPPQKQNIWGPGPRKKSHELATSEAHDQTDSSDSTPRQNQRTETSYFPNTEFSETYENSRKTSQHVVSDFSAGQPLDASSPREEEEEAAQHWSIPDHRSFQDTAIANYQESTAQDKDIRVKKKSFLSFFKKSGKKKSHDDFIQIEPRIDAGNNTDSDIDDHIPDLYGDQSPRFHILPPEKNTDTPPKPAEVQKNLFPSPSNCTEEIADLSQSPRYIHQTVGSLNLPDCVPVQDDYLAPNAVEVIDFGEKYFQGETDLDEAFKERQGRTLERKLSMSKPTNLDDLLAEEPSNLVSDKVEKEEEKDSDTSMYIPEHEKTQEIDIDAILAMSDGPDEDDEVSAGEQDSFEVDRVTRLNTHRNKDIYKFSNYDTNGSTSDYSYPLHKTTTVNGETTFSASPEFSYAKEYSQYYHGSSANETVTHTVKQSGDMIERQPVHVPEEHKDSSTKNFSSDVFTSQVFAEEMQSFHPLDAGATQAVIDSVDTQDEILINSDVETIKRQHDLLISELNSQPNFQKYVTSDDFQEEEIRLQEEKRLLSTANLELQAKLTAKENERKNEELNLMNTENMKEAAVEERPNSRSLETKHAKPKSIFNFDNFKKKESKPRSKDEALANNGGTAAPPKQKSKQAFAFFSSKDRSRPRNTNGIEATKEILNGAPETQFNSNRNTETVPEKVESKEFESGSKHLAQDIISELKRSTLNLTREDGVSTTTKTEEPSFFRSQSRASTRVSRNKSKTDSLPHEEKTENDLKRSDSKSRFSIRMPKKKEKIEKVKSDTRAEEPVDTREQTHQILDQREDQRDNQPNSRPNSRNRREKPQGIAEMFGFRSSKRGKSLERPRSGVEESGRPKSSEFSSFAGRQGVPRSSFSDYHVSSTADVPRHNTVSPPSQGQYFTRYSHPNEKINTISTEPVEKHSARGNISQGPEQIPAADPSEPILDHDHNTSGDSSQLAAPRRQTGRQSGRFRKGLSSASMLSTDHVHNMSLLSQGSNDAQSRFLESFASAESQSQRIKSASVGRAAGNRISRGGNGREMPLHPPGLTSARSEESIREKGPHRPRSKKPGECSVM